MDLEQAASALYGTTTPAPAPAPAAAPAAAPSPAPAPADDQADAPSPAAQALYASDEPGPDKVYGPVERDIASATEEKLGVDREEATAIGREWSPIFREFAVNPTDAQTLAEIGAAAVIDGVSDEQRAEWRSGVQEELRKAFGDTSALALDDARALVAQHPKLGAWLEATGLGDNPRVVLAAAQRARQMRAAGTLPGMSKGRR